MQSEHRGFAGLSDLGVDDVTSGELCPDSFVMALPWLCPHRPAPARKKSVCCLKGIRNDSAASKTLFMSTFYIVISEIIVSYKTQ